jgi:hypothetical protein
MNVKCGRKNKNSKLNTQDLSLVTCDLEKDIETFVEPDILKFQLPKTTGKEMYYIGNPQLIVNQYNKIVEF